MTGRHCYFMMASRQELQTGRLARRQLGRFCDEARTRQLLYGPLLGFDGADVCGWRHECVLHGDNRRVDIDRECGSLWRLIRQGGWDRLGRMGSLVDSIYPVMRFY
jgi:hypothetical protein